MLSINETAQVRKGCWLCLLLFLLSLFASRVWSQSESEYLDSLKGEASNLTLDLEARPAAQLSTQDGDAELPKNTSGSNAGAIKELIPGLTVEQFEQLLKNNYMGSYLFYSRLDDRAKKEAYDFYLNNPDSKTLREKILQLNKQ